MSTFGGVTKEFKRISIDRFDGINLESTLYILSHLHSDHTVGLTSEQFKKRILLNPQIKIYCSKVTKNLIQLEEAYNFLNDAIVPLVENVPSQLCIPCLKENDVSSLTPGDEEERDETVTLTFLPSGHCPGSVMCLIEGACKRILYTGDYRVKGEGLKLLHSFFDENGRPKHLDSLYVDTTFFHPSSGFIPSRSYSLLCATEVIDHWISQGSRRVVNLKFKTNLGYEHLLSAISRHFDMKIHMSELRYARCQRALNGIDGLFTTDPDATQIHVCDDVESSKESRWRKRQSSSSSSSSSTMTTSCPCRVLRETPDEEVRTLTFSAMFFVRETTPDHYCTPVGGNDFRICYSLHPSYDEVCELIDALRPVRAFANVWKPGGRVPEDYDVQQELDRVVERIRSSPCDVVMDNVRDQAERKLKRQFSEDSLANYFFDETQTYLRRNSKRPRLEDHDLSADILSSNESKATDDVDGCPEPSLKRKRDSTEELDDNEGNDVGESSLQTSKRITLDRHALQQHIRKCGNNNGFSKDIKQGLSCCLTSDESDGIQEKGDVNDEEVTTSGDLKHKASEKADSNSAVPGCSDGHVKSETVSKEECRKSEDANERVVATSSATEAIDALKQERECQHQCSEMINLCNDEDEDPSDCESRDGVQSDVLLDSDVTVELSSSFDNADCPNSSCSKRIPNSSTPVFVSGSSSPRAIKILPPILEDQLDDCKIKTSNRISTVPPCSISAPVCDTSGTRPKENSSGDQKVVCIDLTDEIDDDDEEEEDEEYDEDENDEGQSSLRIRSIRRGRISDEDEYDDECGYEGGDECDSPTRFGVGSARRRRDAACKEEEAVDREKEAADRDEDKGKVERHEDDSNDRTSGYDSDVSHFTELRRKSHARFEKLYRRKQRKIRMKNRRQNLRNVAKDDVIVIDDDDDETTETDDSYDYDSDFSSSDYNHYPGRARIKGHRTADDSEQFLVPSVSSSSESSQTLSSEEEEDDDDNVVVVVNCAKSPEGGGGGDGEKENDLENGDGSQPSVNQNAVKTLD